MQKKTNAKKNPMQKKRHLTTSSQMIRIKFEKKKKTKLFRTRAISNRKSLLNFNRKTILCTYTTKAIGWNNKQTTTTTKRV